MKIRDYLDLKEASLKLALLSSFGTDEETVSRLNESFQIAEDESRRLLQGEFGQDAVEEATAILDLPVADFLVARS